MDWLTDWLTKQYSVCRSAVLLKQCCAGTNETMAGGKQKCRRHLNYITACDSHLAVWCTLLPWWQVLMSHPDWPVWGCHGYWLLASPRREIFSAYSCLSYYWDCIIFFPLAQQPLAGQGPLIFEAPHSLGLLCRSYQPDTHTSIYLATHNTHNRQTFMPQVGFKSAIPARKPL